MGLTAATVLTAWGLLSVVTSLVTGAWLASLDHGVAAPVVADEPPAVEEPLAA